MVKRLLRTAATAIHKLLTLGWFLRRPRTFGAHAIALSPQRRLILVKLWYAPGWRLPGGGRDEDESATDAALRELREEIGMNSHGDVKLACEVEESIDFKRDNCSLVIVRHVEFRPRRWSWEVEEVSEFAFEELPPDLSPQARRWINMVMPHL